MGKISSYKTNYENWLKTRKWKEPGVPKVGRIFPVMYHDNCLVRTGTNTAKLKVFIKNTWDWLDIKLKKTDVNYIQRHCQTRKKCVPILRRHGKNWYLDFVFEKKVKIQEKAIEKQIIIRVDLGINNDCVCSAMKSDGTVISRKFLDLSREKDSLNHAINHIKQAQQNGAKRTNS